jgi:LacI family transcriptional regulator
VPPSPRGPGTLAAVSSRGRQRPTIRQLAEYTGLSPAAVSYALRGLHVSAETEERVRAAAAELGYEADPIARALAGGETAVVGLLVGSLADFWNQELVRAVQRELHAADRSTLVADADGEPAREIELAQRLVDHRVDGLVVLPIGPGSGAWTAITEQIPTVTIGDALASVDPAGEVVFDNERGVEETLRHLGELGHRRVTVLSWAVETSPDRGAERAVRAIARALGLDCEIVATAYSLNGSQPLAQELLSGPDRPTAVFCLSDSIAYGVYAACAALGLRIPDDVAVAGFGDHPISRLLTPPLTSTFWDVEHAAGLATGFLLETLGADGGGPTLREVVAPELVTRGSTSRS